MKMINLFKRKEKRQNGHSMAEEEWQPCQYPYNFGTLHYYQLCFIIEGLKTICKNKRNQYKERVVAGEGPEKMRGLSTAINNIQILINTIEDYTDRKYGNHGQVKEERP